MQPSIPVFRCDVCSMSVNSKEQLTQHFSGSRHKRNATKVQGLGSTIMKPTDYFVPSGYDGGDCKQQIMQPQVPDNRATAAVGFSDTYCHSCRVTLTSAAQAEMHYKGAKHRNKLKLLEDRNTGVFEDECSAAKKAKVEICQVCNVKLLTPAVAKPHYAGEKHRKKIALLKSRGLDVSGCERPNPPPLPPISTNVAIPNQNPMPSAGQMNTQIFNCSFCDISVNSQSQMEAHRSGNKHKNRVEKFASLQPVNNSLPTHGLNGANAIPSSVTVASFSQATYMPQVMNYSYNYSAPGQYIAQT